MSADAPDSKLSASQYDVGLKMLILGDSGTGKSAILIRFMDDQFTLTHGSTLGIDFKVRILDMDGKRVRLQIWDTAGQERFRSIATSYFRGVKVFVLVYDVTNRESFNGIGRWIKEIQDRATETHRIMIMANKVDLQRVVTTSEGQECARKVGGLYVETSAKESVNITEAFYSITHDALHLADGKESTPPSTPVIDLTKKPQKKHKKC
eukprot:TRINITY_DN10568_c0_g1_i1.p1 TRINITY_DN10568_c0_g1~~TRINITY_DN10568_c0_g1_i1.p1  ORF type:complete len:208 (+),score=29.89 TRINITY_DN10568_c0_g1_i1:46-669(+)